MPLHKLTLTMATRKTKAFWAVLIQREDRLPMTLPLHPLRCVNYDRREKSQRKMKKGKIWCRKARASWLPRIHLSDMSPLGLRRRNVSATSATWSCRIGRATATTATSVSASSIITASGSAAVLENSTTASSGCFSFAKLSSR